MLENLENKIANLEEFRDDMNERVDKRINELKKDIERIVKDIVDECSVSVFKSDILPKLIGQKFKQFNAEFEIVENSNEIRYFQLRNGYVELFVQRIKATDLPEGNDFRDLVLQQIESILTDLKERRDK